MKHYFINTTHSPNDYFSFNFEHRNVSYIFHSSTDVFSKNSVDEGSLVLVNTILKSVKLSGDVLDMGCGYGTISILLHSHFDANFYLCDVNETAVELAKKNVQQNSVKNVQSVFVSDMFSAVNKTYDTILSNPPIKSGKKKLFEFLETSFQHINSGGNLVVVIKKNLGADSAKKKLLEVFGNCSIIKRDRGYYVMLAQKN